MRIFILEDNPIRIERFVKKFCNHDLTIYSEAKLAIDCLKNSEQFDFIFLDHDLGGLQDVDSNELNTGYTVAKAIVELGLFPKYKIIIHSLNPVGAKNMLSILKEAVYCPGIWLEKEWVGIMERLGE